MTRRNVVLPQPDGPMKDTNSPLPMVEIDIRKRAHRTIVGLERQPEFLGRNDVCGLVCHFWLLTVAPAASKCRTRCIPRARCRRIAQLRPLPLRRSGVSSMSLTLKPTCRLVRPGETYDGKQGLTYFAGIAAETVGSQAICMHILTMPPGARAKAHLHESHETAIYVLSGEVDTWYGDELEHQSGQGGRPLLHSGRRAASAGQPQRQAVVGDHCPHRSQRAGERRAAAGSRRTCACLNAEQAPTGKG